MGLFSGQRSDTGLNQVAVTLGFFGNAVIIVLVQIYYQEYKEQEGDNRT
jgi:hypothetical protein